MATVNIERRRFNNAWFAAGPGIISVLYGIHMLGSLAAYREAASGWKPAFQEPLKELADIVQAEAGHRASELLADVQFSPLDTLHRFAVEEPMPYKQEKTHWLNWQGSIYR